MSQLLPPIPWGHEEIDYSYSTSDSPTTSTEEYPCDDTNYYDLSELNESVIPKGASMMNEMKAKLEERELAPVKEQHMIKFKEEIEPELLNKTHQTSFTWGFDLFKWIHNFWGTKLE